MALNEILSETAWQRCYVHVRLNALLVAIGATMPGVRREITKRLAKWQSK